MASASRRHLAFIAALALGVLWVVAHILRPTLAGRKLRQFSPLYAAFPADAFHFAAPRPSWLIPTPAAPPLVLRIAVISHPAEIARRAAIREAVFTDVPTDDVRFDYRFFVGRVPGQRSRPWSALTLDELIDDEKAMHGDVEILNMTEGSHGLGVKRHAALQWAAEVPHSTYDLFMTFDSDSYIRLAALARRFRHMGIGQRKPRDNYILWAHTQFKREHWRINTTTEDGLNELYRGAGYEYPLGIAYLMSSKLTAHLASTELPTHVQYPMDDVLVGSWIRDNAPETEIVHDPEGFHNPEKDWKIVPIDWDTVCVHHSEPIEMRALRRREEFADEFVQQL